MLTNTAFNAMLKTLEEPPEYLKFVLATTDPQKVPVTVLSRCLQFNLRPIAPKTICEHLEKVLLPEGVKSDDQALRLLARAARGSMRDALSLTDQAIAFGSGRLDENTVRQMLGSVDHSYVFRLVESLAIGDGKTVVETSETLRLNGLSAASILEDMTLVLQRMAVLQAVPLIDDDSTDPDAGQVARLAQLMPADEIQLLYSICLHGRGELGLAPDEYAAMTMVLLRALAFKPIDGQRVLEEKKTLSNAMLSHSTPPTDSRASVESPSLLATEDAVYDDENDPSAPDIAKVDAIKLRAIVSGTPVQHLPAVNKLDSSDIASHALHDTRRDSELANQVLATMVEVPVQVQAESRTIELVDQVAELIPVQVENGDFWHQTVSDMASREHITALVKELALQSQLIARDTAEWILRVERESLNQAGTRDRLATALQAAGFAVRLSVEVGQVTDTPARRNAVASAEINLAAKKVIADDSFVQAMMREFAAKIISGSIKPS